MTTSNQNSRCEISRGRYIHAVVKLWYQGIFPVLLLVALLELVSGKRWKQSEDYMESRRWNLLCPWQKVVCVGNGCWEIGKWQPSFISEYASHFREMLSWIFIYFLLFMLQPPIWGGILGAISYFCTNCVSRGEYTRRHWRYSHTVCKDLNFKIQMSG